MTIDDPVILIRPTRLYRPDMSADELYEATRGVWRVNVAQAERARYALAVVGGVVVEAYEIDGWQPAGTAEYRYRPRSEVERPGRYEFSGHRADSAGQRYVGHRCASTSRRGIKTPFATSTAKDEHGRRVPGGVRAARGPARRPAAR